MIQFRPQIPHPLQENRIDGRPFNIPDSPHPSPSDREYPRDLNPPRISPIKEAFSNSTCKIFFGIGLILSGILIGAALPFNRQHPRGLNPSRVSLIKKTIGDLPWKRMYKIGIILSGIVIGAAFIDDLFRILFKKNIYNNNASDLLNQSGRQVINQGITEEKIPCVIKMEPYSLDMDGDCAKEEIEAARIEYKILMENYDKQIKEETAKEVEEELRKFDERFAPILERLEAHEMDRKESERRRRNPTLEEKEEDERDSIRAAVEESPFMKSYFRAKYPQYFDPLPAETETCDEACQKEARKILQVSATANCQEIKRQYRALSLKAHPDKNPESDKNNFLVVSEAYQILCP